MLKTKDYLNHDATDLARLVRTRQVSATELLESALRQTEQVNSEINAVVLKDYEAARDRAKRFDTASTSSNHLAFGGVPYLIKDLGAEVAGLPMSMGSRHYRNYIPAADSSLVSASKACGLNIFGKTNTSEIGQVAFTEPALFGPCRNPWNTSHTAGGSSGGAAAAVAAGIVPLAHASDGGGSIRIPSSCCGVFGFKPSRPLARNGSLSAADLLIVNHAVSRSVRDSALLLDLTSSNPQRPIGSAETYLGSLKEPLRPLRIAYLESPMFAERLSDDVQTALELAAMNVSSLGHTVETVDLAVDFRAASQAFLTLWSLIAEDLVLNSEVVSGKRPVRREFEIATWTMAQVGRKLGKDSLANALEVQATLSQEMTKLFRKYDVVLCATVASAPIKIGQMAPTALERLQMRMVTMMPAEILMRRVLMEASTKAFAWAGCTELFNLTGQPAMSLPLHWNAQGLPIGVQFAARQGADSTLLQLAAQIESEHPWFNRLPAIANSNRDDPICGSVGVGAKPTV